MGMSSGCASLLWAACATVANNCHARASISSERSSQLVRALSIGHEYTVRMVLAVAACTLHMVCCLGIKTDEQATGQCCIAHKGHLNVVCMHGMCGVPASSAGEGAHPP